MAQMSKMAAYCFVASGTRRKNTEYQRSRNDHSPMSNHGAYANHLLYLDEPGGFARSAEACVKGCPWAYLDGLGKSAGAKRARYGMPGGYKMKVWSALQT